MEWKPQLKLENIALEQIFLSLLAQGMLLNQIQRFFFFFFFFFFFDTIHDQFSEFLFFFYFSIYFLVVCEIRNERFDFEACQRKGLDYHFKKIWLYCQRCEEKTGKYKSYF